MADYSAIESFTRHGGAYDRGGADAWYRRGRNPHYYTGATHSSVRINQEGMREEEIAAYNKGYDDTFSGSQRLQVPNRGH